MNFKKNQEIDKNIAQIIEKAQNQSYEQGKTEGFALGLTRGEFQTKIEIAKKMAENKIDFENIRNVVIASTMLVLGLGGAILTIESGDISISITGMSLAAIVGIILNLFLPNKENEK